MLVDEPARKRGERFYRVVHVPDGEALFSNEILDFWFPLAFFPGYPEGYETGICRIKSPFTSFRRMERHKSSCEILIPVSGDMFVPLAPPSETPVIKDISIVRVRKGDLIYMEKGVWHFAAGPINQVALDYFVILRRNAPQEDLEMKDLERRIVVAL